MKRHITEQFIGQPFSKALASHKWIFWGTLNRFFLFFSSQESKSFAVNMFKGQIATSQVFPFPKGMFGNVASSWYS